MQNKNLRPYYLTPTPKGAGNSLSSAEADLMSSFADAFAHFGAYGLVGPLLGEPVPQGGRLGVGFIITGRCPVLVLTPRWGYDY